MIQTTLLPLDKLEQNTGQIEGLPRNPRTWTLSEINRIAASLKETPELFEARPILVLPKNGKYVIIGGNLRYEGCRKNKDKEVPCFVLPKDTPLEKLKELVIKDNGSFGAWDYDALANEWDNGRLPDWGVPVWEMEQEDKQEEERKEVKEDDFNEEKDGILVRCKPGDIWQLGDHRLMCGDSTDLETVKTLMGGVRADLWLTDPPYNLQYEGKTKEKLTIQNDSMNDASFRNFLIAAYAAANAALKEGAVFYIWHSDSEGYNFRAAANDTGLKVRECLIWNKSSFVFGRQDYHWKHESCLYGWKEGGSHQWFSDRKQTTVIDFERPNRNGDHPTMKPVGLFAYLMQNSSKAGDNVLDTFGGSGTTLIAAEQLGRKAFLMELDPHYCDVIIARWEKLTGKQAQKIN